MALCKTDAIVLRSYRHGETSRIAILYSKAFGKTKVIAKGSRNPKSRFGAALEPLTEIAAVLYYRQGREVHTLGQADLLSVFPEAKSNLKKLPYASALVELTDHLAAYEEPNIAAYRLLQGCLGGIERAPEAVAEKFLWHFQLRMAELLGYRPQFARCAHCGAGVTDEKLRFDLAGGGPVCEVCREGRAGQGEHGPPGGEPYVELSHEAATFLHKLQGTSPEHVERVTTRAGYRQEIRGMLAAFLEYHTEDRRRLKSLSFLAKMSPRPEC